MSTTFESLGLATPLLRALTTAGYTEPTPIQSQAIPHALAGRDVQGIAQTGTGKTAAFALPILQRLLADRKRAPARGCRVLVLSPTRELASQIAESFVAYARGTGIRVAVMFGGTPKGRQARAIAGGIDVLVACPGRLLDHMGDGAVRLDAVEVLVLDEADHMLDLGFVIPIRRIVAHIPAQRQTMFFSATMPPEISKLAGAMLRDPVHVAVTPVATTVDKVDQRVIFVDTARKRQVLADLLRDDDMSRTLVFTRTKHGADRVTEHLERAGQAVAAIHGNKSQGQRERALAAFKAGHVRVLVATDIAARGIDVDGVTHVVNFDLPNVPEAYVHRIGRTARAGRAGVAISFCDASERPHLRGIEKLIRTRLPVEQPSRLAA
jgi:ATP-dependent RNA helicase RhlE